MHLSPRKRCGTCTGNKRTVPAPLARFGPTEKTAMPSTRAEKGPLLQPAPSMQSNVDLDRSNNSCWRARSVREGRIIRVRELWPLIPPLFELRQKRRGLARLESPSNWCVDAACFGDYAERDQTRREQNFPLSGPLSRF